MPKRFRSLSRALKNRNYRLFFVGQGVSLVGTWMEKVAMGWLVYRLTDSAMWLGLTGFCGQFSTFLLAPLAGVLADRISRRKILVVTQILALMQGLAMAALVMSDRINLVGILCMAVLLGTINAFDLSTRQSLVVDLIEDKADLGNAIALNSSLVNMARLVGPSLAGFLVAGVGEGLCFLINGLSFIAPIITLSKMSFREKTAPLARRSFFAEIAEGLTYAHRSIPISSILWLFALVAFAGMPYNILLPVFARDILNGGPETLGFLMGSAGIGALVAGGILASRLSVLGLGKWLPIAAAGLGVSLMFFSRSETYELSLLLMALNGFFQVLVMAVSNTLLQTLVDDEMRGRVMSFYIMAFMGSLPLGSAVAGNLSGYIGVQWTVFMGGACCIVGAAYFALKLPQLRVLARPIYIRKGIIEENST